MIIMTMNMFPKIYVHHLCNHSSTELNIVLLCHKRFREDEKMLPSHATDKHWY